MCVVRLSDLQFRPDIPKLGVFYVPTRVRPNSFLQKGAPCRDEVGNPFAEPKTLYKPLVRASPCPAARRSAPTSSCIGCVVFLNDLEGVGRNDLKLNDSQCNELALESRPSLSYRQVPGQ